jgi:DNA-binding response OmpR family regulator
LADLVAFTLRREGFSVIQALDGESALQQWQVAQPDLIVLDVNLPKSVPHWDGFRLCQHIRQQSTVPIILLTVRSAENDIVQGLTLGADDYIVKPFSPRQLVARIQAALRRANAHQPRASLTRENTLFQLDTERRIVRRAAGAPIPLTALETRLLEILIHNTGIVLSTEKLLTAIWGSGGGSRDMLRQLVHRLREKIDSTPGEQAILETIPGVGYCLRKPPAVAHE